MEIDELIESFNFFIKNEADKIQYSINNNTEIKSNFFEKKTMYYSKDYGEKLLFSNLIGTLGIYFFIINEDVYLNFSDVYNYNECAMGGKINMYHYKEIKLKKNDCFYLGSATSNSLYTRLNQHFKKSENYHSLHLSETKRKMLSDKMIIYAFPVKNKNYKHINVLLKSIELELHKRFNPIAGGKNI